VLATLRKFGDLVQSYQIIRWEQVGPSYRLRARLLLKDGSHLDVRETIIEGTIRKYSYHWQDNLGQLRARWDNAPDWDVVTFPHHRHVGHGESVEPSYERTLAQVLAAIQDELSRAASAER
jgi:hypothetical protein